MAVNQVIVGDEVKLDLTGDTVSENNLLAGATAHNAAGEPITGTLGAATQSADGLMSAEDKGKLDGIEANANYTVVDVELSETSENPVQNKVIAGLLNQIGGGIKVITGSYTTGQYTGSTSTINIGAKPIAFFISPGYNLSSDSQRSVYLCIGDQIVSATGYNLQITDYGFSHISSGGKQKHYYLAIVNE